MAIPETDFRDCCCEWGFERIGFTPTVDDDTPWSGFNSSLFADKLYLTSGQFTSTIRTSLAFAFSGAATGVSYDASGDTPRFNNPNRKLTVNFGQFSSTIITSQFTSFPVNGTGISFDGTNTPWCDAFNDLYLTSGQFTSTIKDSLFVGSSFSPHSISWDGTDTPWCGYTGASTGKLFLQSGQFVSTIKTSQDVSSVDETPTGLEWDGTNIVWSGSTTAKLYLQSGGFSSTIKTSQDVSSVSTLPRDASTNLFPGAI